MKLNFIGPSYEDESVNFDAQRCINQEPIKSETGDSKTVAKLQGTPGLLNHATCLTSRTRGAIKAAGRAFFVVGARLQEVLSNGTVTQYDVHGGSVLGTDAGFVSMDYNQNNQICFVDGSATGGYLFVLTNSNNVILDGGFDNAAYWTAGAGWTVAASVATAAGAINTNLDTASAISIIAGVSYSVTYIVTRSAGSVTVNVGGTAGTSRSAAGTYTETIVAGSTGKLRFSTAGFTGTVNTVSVTAVDSLIQITDAYFLGADTVTYAGGYFVFNKPDTGQYYCSALQDGSTGDPLLIETAESSPDLLLGVKRFHKELWLIGTDSIDVAYASGNIDFPFTPNKGVSIEYGCAAIGSVATTANSMFWLGNDPDGNRVIWMATGYQPTKISNFGVDYALKQISDISDATAYTYQENGKWYYVINFTLGNQTWVYNVNMGVWHERLYWNADLGIYERHRSEMHVFCFGKHLVGDYATGDIYDMSLNYYDDDGDVIRRERRSQHTSDDLEFLYYPCIQIDMETGVGLVTGEAEDMDPQLGLSWSDDSGHTFSATRYESVGKIGEYTKRVMYWQCGRSRDRILKAVFTARCKYVVFAAHSSPRAGLA